MTNSTMNKKGYDFFQAYCQEADLNVPHKIDGSMLTVEYDDGDEKTVNVDEVSKDELVLIANSFADEDLQYLQEAEDYQTVDFDELSPYLYGNPYKYDIEKSDSDYEEVVNAALSFLMDKFHCGIFSYNVDSVRGFPYENEYQVKLSKIVWDFSESY